MGRMRDRRALAALGELLGLTDAANPFETLQAAVDALGGRLDAKGNLLQSPVEQFREVKRRRLSASSPNTPEAPVAEPDQSDAGSESGDEIEPVSMDAELMQDRRSAQEVSSPLSGEPDVRRSCMEWLVAPCTLQDFFTSTWDRHPLLIQRPACRQYFEGLFGLADVRALLQSRPMQYGLNVDVTKVIDGQRQTFNSNAAAATEPGSCPGEEPAVADAAVVMRRFEREGCSVRVLHPQRWHDPLWRLLASLEHELGCPVGCNTYLTPAGNQGFAPHWDDIDALVLQTEGRKQWRLYAPLSPADVLPRVSSGDFEESQLGQPILQAVLEPGDMLYMPRGCIHQAVAVGSAHSLHITVSASQRRTWADLLAIALPRALELAAEQRLALRQGLPRDLHEHLGVARAEEPGEQPSAERSALLQHAEKLTTAVLRELPLDAAADRMAVQFMQHRLPPVGLAECNAQRGRAAMESASAAPEQVVKVRRPGIAALTVEDEACSVHHCLCNARDLHAELPFDSDLHPDDDTEDAPGCLRFNIDAAPLLEMVLLPSSSTWSDPAYLGVSISCADCEEAGEPELVLRLWQAGLVDVQ